MALGWSPRSWNCVREPAQHIPCYLRATIDTSPELLHSQDTNHSENLAVSFYHTSCMHPCFSFVSLHIPETSPSCTTQQLKGIRWWSPSVLCWISPADPILTREHFIHWRTALHPWSTPASWRRVRRNYKPESRQMFSSFLSYSSYPPDDFFMKTNPPSLHSLWCLLYPYTGYWGNINVINLDI